MIEDLGGRKFILAMTIVMLGSLLVWFYRIDPKVYEYLILVTAGAYITGNVAQKVVTEGTNVNTNKA